MLEINPVMDFGARWEARLGLPAGTLGEGLADVWAAGAIGTMTEEQVLRAIGDRLGLTRDQVGTMMADMWVQYVGVANTEVIEFAAYGFAELFDEIVYSHEVGMHAIHYRDHARAMTELEALLPVRAVDRGDHRAQ